MKTFIMKMLDYRAVVSGGAGGALASPEFGNSVNPIPTRGAHYAHPITASTPGFQNLTTALHYKINFKVQTLCFEVVPRIKVF